jgi:hypothetical protein
MLLSEARVGAAQVKRRRAEAAIATPAGLDIKASAQVERREQPQCARTNRKRTAPFTLLECRADEAAD